MSAGDGDESDGSSRCCSHRPPVREPAAGQNGLDHPPLGHVPDGRQDVGDNSGRGFDLYGSQLVEQPDQPAVSGELRLAEQAGLDVRDERGGRRQPPVEDPGKLEHDLRTADIWRTAARAGN
jgi:hypothetical protein